jgi:hypothetical protein
MNGAFLFLPHRGVGLSHLAEKAEEEVLVPSSGGDFSAHGHFRGVGAEKIEGELSQDREVFGGGVLSGSVGVFLKRDIEHPMQLVLDGPMGTDDLQQFPGRKVLGENEVADDWFVGAALVPASSRGDAS